MQIVGDSMHVASTRALTGLGKVKELPPQLATCGSGCLTTRWSLLVLKRRALMKGSRLAGASNKLRRRTGFARLSAIYMEYADCAERKFFKLKHR